MKDTVAWLQKAVLMQLEESEAAGADLHFLKALGLTLVQVLG